MYQAHLTQIMLSTDEWSPSPRPDWRPSHPCCSGECRAVLDHLQLVKGQGQGLDPLAVWQDLMAASLGFLGCAALFYHYLSGVAAPAELTELQPPHVEFTHLAR